MAKLHSVIQYAPAVLLATSLAGCANVAFPTQNEIDKTVSGNDEFKSYPAYEIETTEEARAYVASAKSKMRTMQSYAGYIEFAADAGIAAAGITGVLGGALNWGNHLIIRSAVYGGGIYAAEQGIDPRPQENTLQSGIGVLDCIGRTAEPAYSWVAPTNALLTPINDALDKLQADVDRAKGDGSTADTDPTLQTAEDDIVGAQAYLDAHQPMIYAQVLAAVNLVIDATNQLLLNETSDPAAFSSLIKGISATPATSASSTSAPAPKPAAGSPASGLGGSGTAVSAHFTLRQGDDDSAITADKAILDNAISAAQEKLGSGNVNKASASFDACIPGAAILTLTPPATNITLSAGDLYDVTVSGGTPSWTWSGQVPPATILTATNKSSQTIELNAVAELQQSYQIVISVPPTQISLSNTPVTTTITIGPAATAGK